MLWRKARRNSESGKGGRSRENGGLGNGDVDKAHAAEILSSPMSEMDPTATQRVEMGV